MTYSQIVQKHIIKIYEYFYSRKSQTTTKLESQEVFFFNLEKKNPENALLRGEKLGQEKKTGI